MAIVNLYSKQKRARETPLTDVYAYDEVPAPLRSQVRQMFQEAYEYSTSGRNRYVELRLSMDHFKAIVRILRREYGRDRLAGNMLNALEEFQTFVGSCVTDEFIDCALLFGHQVTNSPHMQQSAKDEYIRELNYRFKESGFGYEYVEGHMIRIDSSVVHSEVVKPAISLLTSDPIFRGAEDELFLAFEKYRAHDNKGAVAEASKAFESTMKAILDARGFTDHKNDPASRLITACIDNEVLPAYIQNHYNGLKMMLESGVPTVRNKTSGHGQGPEIKPLDDHIASYVLHTALANIKLLIECYKKLP